MVREHRKDQVESILQDLIDEKHFGAVRFFMTTQMRDRGYAQTNDMYVHNDNNDGNNVIDVSPNKEQIDALIRIKNGE